MPEEVRPDFRPPVPEQDSSRPIQQLCCSDHELGAAPVREAAPHRLKDGIRRRPQLRLQQLRQEGLKDLGLLSLVPDPTTEAAPILESFPCVKEGSRVHQRRTGQDPVRRWSELPTEPRPARTVPLGPSVVTPWLYGLRPRACSAPLRLRAPLGEARRDSWDRFFRSRREPCPSAVRPSRPRSGSILPRTHSMRSSV